MKFSCDRCHKRFSTTDEPVAGRVYRVPCKCGNTIVVQVGAGGGEAGPRAAPAAPARRAGPPPLPAAPAAAPAVVEPRFTAAHVAALADDPFARAQERPGLGVLLACASEEVTPTVLATALALRDPHAADVSTLYEPEPADPFEAELRRTRTHALAIGGAAGAGAGAACAALLTVLLLRPWSSVAAGAPPAQPEPIAIQVAHRVPERPPAARRAPVVRTAAAAVPRARPAEPPAPTPAAEEPVAAARPRGAGAPAAELVVRPAVGRVRDERPATDPNDRAEPEPARVERAGSAVAPAEAVAAAAAEPDRLDTRAAVDAAPSADVDAASADAAATADPEPSPAPQPADASPEKPSGADAPAELPARTD